MRRIKKIVLIILFTPFISNGQVKVKGKVVNKEGEKVIASIYQYGICFAKDFQGDFEISIDSLGAPYFFSALGYENKKVKIHDSTFLTVILDAKKYNTRKASKNMRRRERFLKKDRKRALQDYNGCCFVSGTMILMADGTEKRIEMLRVNDSILTYDFESQNIIISSISDLDTVNHYNIISIALENGIKIMNTADHPYYVFGKGICSYDPISTYDNYGIKARQLEIGDKCYSYSNGELIFINVLSVEKINGTFISYNISELNNNNNYFANGVLVNNENTNKIQLLTTKKAH